MKPPIAMFDASNSARWPSFDMDRWMDKNMEERNKLKYNQFAIKENRIGEYDLDPQPKDWDPATEKREWKTPDRKKKLKRYWFPGNSWAYILQETDPDRFWLYEVQGPEHGLSFYGPFDGKADKIFENCKEC